MAAEMNPRIIPSRSNGLVRQRTVPPGGNYSGIHFSSHCIWLDVSALWTDNKSGGTGSDEDFFSTGCAEFLPYPEPDGNICSTGNRHRNLRKYYFNQKIPAEISLEGAVTARTGDC